MTNKTIRIGHSDSKGSVSWNTGRVSIPDTQFHPVCCTNVERKAFLFYCLMFCVDFMGVRGMQFGDKTIEVNDAVVDRLNRIYEELWEEYGGQYHG